MEGSKYTSIKNNSFNEFGYTATWSYAGILMKSSSNFKIMDNDFYLINKGINIINSGAGGGSIASLNRREGNIFYECPLDVETNFDNPRLQIKCNTSVNEDPNFYDGTNWNNYGIFTHQGQQDNTLEARKPAGNAFFPPLEINKKAYKIILGLYR